jgi:hypothetical protein
MRGGEEFAGAPGGARVGKFFGLGSRVVCGEDNGAAVADATAVDMVLPTSGKKSPGWRWYLRWYLEDFRSYCDSQEKTIQPLLDIFDVLIQLRGIGDQGSLDDEVVHQWRPKVESRRRKQPPIPELEGLVEA